MIFKCPKCGKILDGVTLDYKIDWFCSECIEDKSDTLHCERGSKVIANGLDNGWNSDSEKANRFLTKNLIYEVDELNIGGSYSTISLKEIPGEKFNTVHFKRCN